MQTVQEVYTLADYCEAGEGSAAAAAAADGNRVVSIDCFDASDKASFMFSHCAKRELTLVIPVPLKVLKTRSNIHRNANWKNLNTQ